MKKQLLTIFTFTFSVLSFGQVGMNTATPAATLDVVSKTTDGSKPEGIIAPRLTGNQIKLADSKYGINQKGVIVYATSATTAPTTKTANITSEGYYYFNGTIWNSLSGDVTSDAFIDDNANTMVKLGATSAGAARGANTDFVIKDGGNVGIGTATPTDKLDVEGSISIRPTASGTASNIKFMEATANGTNRIVVKAPENVAVSRTFTLPSNDPVNGYLLYTDDSGNTSWGAANPPESTAASIALKGNPSINTGAVPGNTINLRFFQSFDEKITDPNNLFNLSTGTYTAPQPGKYLITAYIVPNASPDKNVNGNFYVVNLEVRKNSGGNANGGINIMDASTIRYATPGVDIARYTVGLSGMVNLNTGDTLNLVPYLTGTNTTTNGTGQSFPPVFSYAEAADYKAVFSVTAL